MKRFAICLVTTFSLIFGSVLWFHVMKLIFGPANAFVYIMMELAAITIAGIVWAFVKDWMAPLMTKEDWDECMDAIENRTIEKLRRQIDYREARKAEKGVTEVELRSNFATDTYELVVKYENGIVKVQQIDPMAIFEYGGIGKYMQDLERRLGFELKKNV